MLGVALALDGTLVTIATGIEAAARADVETAMDADQGEIDRALQAAKPDHRQKAIEATYRHALTRLAPSFTTPLPGAVELVQELQALRVPLAALANGYSGATRAMCATIGFEGQVLCSEDIEVRFPEPAAFASLASTLMLPADRIWFISTDLNREIRSAHACGFQTIYVGQGVPRDPLPEGTSQVQDLLETLEILREPYTRSALELRYIMRTALHWRPGHVIEPDNT